MEDVVQDRLQQGASDADRIATLIARNRPLPPRLLDSMARQAAITGDNVDGVERALLHQLRRVGATRPLMNGLCAFYLGEAPPAEREARLSAQLTGEPALAPLMQVVTRYGVMLSCGADFVRLAERALAAWPDSADAAALHQRLAHAAQMIGPADQQLAAIGRELDRHAEERGLEITGLAQAFAEQVGARGLTRPLVDQQPGPQMCVAPDAETLTIVFRGLRNNQSPTAVVDALLAAEGHSILQVGDPAMLLGINGLEGLGETFAASLAGMRAMIARTGCRKVQAIGISAGGFGAVQYGLALGAERILCISGPTRADRAFLSQIGDTRGRSVAARIEKHCDPQRLDLRPLITQAAGRTRIDMLYGADMPQDRAHAEAISTLPGVRLLPVPGVTHHDCKLEVLRRGALRDLLANRDIDLQFAA